MDPQTNQPQGSSGVKKIQIRKKTLFVIILTLFVIIILIPFIFYFANGGKINDLPEAIKLTTSGANTTAESQIPEYELEVPNNSSLQKQLNEYNLFNRNDIKILATTPNSDPPPVGVNKVIFVLTDKEQPLSKLEQGGKLNSSVGQEYIQPLKTMKINVHIDHEILQSQTSEEISGLFSLQALYFVLQISGHVPPTSSKEATDIFAQIAREQANNPMFVIKK